jgi:protein-arginine kinase activator protein McsA
MEKCLDCGKSASYTVVKDTGLQLCDECYQVFEVEFAEWNRKEDAKWLK